MRRLRFNVKEFLSKKGLTIWEASKITKLPSYIFRELIDMPNDISAKKIVMANKILSHFVDATINDLMAVEEDIPMYIVKFLKLDTWYESAISFNSYVKLEKDNVYGDIVVDYLEITSCGEMLYKKFELKEKSYEALIEMFLAVEDEYHILMGSDSLEVREIHRVKGDDVAEILTGETAENLILSVLSSEYGDYYACDQYNLNESGISFDAMVKGIKEQYNIYL